MDKIFVYLRLRAGSVTIARSKIREFGALGSLLAQFLQKAMNERLELPNGVDLASGEPPVLEYVDSNTEQVLISFRVDPVEKVQIVEGRIPPDYQPRMLDPEVTAYSGKRFVEAASEDAPEERKRELCERVARSQMDLLERIRDEIDDEGNFVVCVPFGQ